MNKTKLAITAFIIAMLFVSAIAGTMFYYNGVVNDRNLKIASLNSQIADLTNETINLNNTLTNLNSTLANLTDGIANLTIRRAKITDFSSSGPSSIVFGVSGYGFKITVTNIGNVILENMTLEVNLTLSDGESSNWSKQIDMLGIGEAQQVSWSIDINNVSVNLLKFSQTWTFVITATPKVNIAEQTFTSMSSFS